jgi:acyl-CoA synthetase (AMP-forming)/AMP-acid ligase II
MCRNHRGFVEALVAGNRIGADVLLLNTSFAGPALADVLVREAADAAIYDEEFAEAVDHALAQMPAAKKILAWRDDTEVGLPRHDGTLTLDQMISDHTNEVPERATHKSRTILLTSGTTGSPKGAKLGSGDLTTLAAVLTRTPWRAEETVVIAAPMFHAWGYGQLVFAALMACTVVTRRKFDPEATLGLIDRHLATGLAVVPVMLDRIMDLPEDVRSRYSCRSLRFATASGSRMRPDVVIGFMNQFGDVIVNNYNATEAGLIASATPQDLRAAPDTAGKPALGTRVRILDEHVREVPTGEVGQIFVHNGTHFEGYSAGATKEFRDGFMASGDVGFLDDNGRLFVVGRDDEMIVSGGENIHPIEVEKSLVGHPEVAEAAVIGVDDEEFGQRLAAFVVLRSDATATPEVLKGYVRQNLANYKVPRQIIVLGELPRNATGKVLRSQLRALIA